MRVLVHGEQVGTLAMTEDGALAFEYSTAWIAHGFSISPLSLPLHAGVFVAPLRPPDGVFDVFDDILPDGSGIRKIHMVSAGALFETSHRIPNLDYRTLMQLTWRITGNAADIELLYRLMCFNVFIGNRDDHSKNFSYLYDEENPAWRLAPAYDPTTNPGMYGERATTVNEKGRDISLVDLCAIDVGAGITESRARSIALDIQELVRERGLLDT